MTDMAMVSVLGTQSNLSNPDYRRCDEHCNGVVCEGFIGGLLLSSWFSNVGDELKEGVKKNCMKKGECMHTDMSAYMHAKIDLQRADLARVGRGSTWFRGCQTSVLLACALRHGG